MSSDPDYVLDILTAERARERILTACRNPPDGVESPTFVYAARNAESAGLVAKAIARDLGHSVAIGTRFGFDGGATLIVANMGRPETVEGIAIDGLVVEDGVGWERLRPALIAPDRPRGWVAFALSEPVPRPPGQPTTSGSNRGIADSCGFAARMARVVKECEGRVRSSDGYWSRVTDEIRAEATKEVSRLHEALRDACEENRKLRDQLEAAKSAETAHEAAREALREAGLADCATVASGIQHLERDRRELEERLRQAGDMPSQPRNRRERRDRIIEVIEGAMLKEVNRPDVLEQLSRVHERMREGACAS
jgi:hypothetical protein